MKIETRSFRGHKKAVEPSENYVVRRLKEPMCKDDTYEQVT